MELTGMEGLDRILKQRGLISKLKATTTLQKKNEKEPKESLYKCEKCKDTGYIITNKPHLQPIMTPCRCAEADKVKRLWRNSGINTDDLEKNFKNFETWNSISRKMKDTASNYCIKFEKIKSDRINSILLCGNPGSGKTHIALALANNFLTKDIKVVYMPYRDIVTSLKQNMIDEEYYKKTLSKYQTAEILLIDDLYKGKITESDINIMFELINYRYLNRLPIIVSTEFTVERLLNFDEAIGSRLYEMSKGYIVEIEGTENNYRLK